MSYHQPKAFTTEQGFWSQKKKTVWERMKDSLQTVFFFYRIAFFMDSRILPYTAHGISLSSFIRFTIAPISVGISLRTPVPPWFMEWLHALCEIPAYLRQLTYALRRRVLGWKYIQLLAVPSAVHLAACISTRFSASRTLCVRYAALISASTVLMCSIFRQYTTHDVKCQIFLGKN